MSIPSAAFLAAQKRLDRSLKNKNQEPERLFSGLGVNTLELVDMEELIVYVPTVITDESTADKVVALIKEKIEKAKEAKEATATNPAPALAPAPVSNAYTSAEQDLTPPQAGWTTKTYAEENEQFRKIKEEYEQSYLNLKEIVLNFESKEMTENHQDACKKHADALAEYKKCRKLYVDQIQKHLGSLLLTKNERAILEKVVGSAAFRKATIKLCDDPSDALDVIVALDNFKSTLSSEPGLRLLSYITAIEKNHLAGSNINDDSSLLLRVIKNLLEKKSRACKFHTRFDKGGSRFCFIDGAWAACECRRCAV